jgi:hypothetical protein
MNVRADMAFEPASGSERLRGDGVPDFANMVRDCLPFLDKRDLAREFEVPEWIVSRWADGTACPGTHIQVAILSWITRQAINVAQVSESVAVSNAM